MHLSAKFLILSCIFLTFACSFGSPAYAFEPDAHYAWTYYLALQVGYTPRQAFQLASATFAIDEDKDTGPMEATPGDAVFGADHPGLTGTKHPRIAAIWSRFHAFAREGESKLQISDSRQKDLDYLWALALKQRNPGPFIHYTQDLYSHSGWDNVRGHAAGGHVPDYLSNDSHYSELMSEHTIRVLQDFKRQALMGEESLPEQVDMARIREVLKRLIDANPPVWGPPNYIPYKEIGRPSLVPAIKVINQAIKEDRAAGRIHPFAGDLLDRTPTSHSWDLPWHWHQYEFNGNGEVRAPVLEGYALEEIHTSVLAAGVSDRSPEPVDIFSRLQISVELQYEVRNAFDRAPLEGVAVAVKNFYGPDPGDVDIDQLPGRIETQRLKNGEYKVRGAYSPTPEEFKKGNLVWISAIQVEGRKPIITKVGLPCQQISGAAVPESERLIQKYYDDAQKLTTRSPCTKVEDAIEAVKKIADLDPCLNTTDTQAKIQGLEGILTRSKQENQNLMAAIGSVRNYIKKCDATSATSMIAQARQTLSGMACRFPDQPWEGDIEALEAARNKVTSDRQNLLTSIDSQVSNAEEAASRCDEFDVKSAGEKLEALLKEYSATCSSPPAEGTAAAAKIQQLLSSDENKDAAQKAIAAGKEALKRCDVLEASAAADELEFLGKVCGLDAPAEVQNLRTSADRIGKLMQTLQENVKGTLDIARTAWQSCDIAKVKWAASEVNRIVDRFQACPEYPPGVASDVEEIQKLVKTSEHLKIEETRAQIDAKLNKVQAFLNGKNNNDAAASQLAEKELAQAEMLLNNAQPEECFADLDLLAAGLRSDLDLTSTGEVEDIPDDADDFGDDDPGIDDPVEPDDSGMSDTDIEDIPDDWPTPPDDAKPQQPQPPTTGRRWSLVSVQVSPEKPYTGWNYTAGGSSADYTVYTGDKALFTWTPPPQQIDSNGVNMLVTVTATPVPNSRIAAIIGFSTSGFEADNLPSEKTIAYAKAENGAASDQKSAKLVPRSTSTDLMIKVSFMWAINFTYTYKRVP